MTSAQVVETLPTTIDESHLRTSPGQSDYMIKCLYLLIDFGFFSHLPYTPFPLNF